MNNNENPIQAPGGDISQSAGGGMMFVGQQAVATVQMITIRRSLKFEIERGMKMTRIPIVPTLQRMGVTTARTKVKAYDDLNRLMVEAGYEDLPLVVKR